MAAVMYGVGVWRLSVVLPPRRRRPGLPFWTEIPKQDGPDTDEEPLPKRLTADGKMEGREGVRTARQTGAA